MSSRHAGAVLAVLVALGTNGCASALRPLDRSDDLAPDAAAVADPERAAALERNAAAAFELRPDGAAVDRAESLWLQAARADPDSVAAVVGVARARIWRASHAVDAETRETAARGAVQAAQRCGERRPALADCHYWLALAVGVQAREARSTAVDGLRVMVRELALAIDSVPDLDYAGPHRVLAQVLVRAPGWPSGPGDPDTGLVHALAAYDAFPEYPPNVIVLAEAHAAVDNDADAAAFYARAVELAERWRDDGHPDAEEWLTEARR